MHFILFYFISKRNTLVLHVQGGAGLDLVAHVLVLDHDAALGRVSGAAASVDQEARAAAHRVRGRRVLLGGAEWCVQVGGG